MATRQKISVGASSAGQTILGPQIQIKGRIEGEEDLRIEGRVEGEIRLSETLYVEEQGVVLAEVDARDVVISGILVGNVAASNSVSLNPGGKLVGDIVAPRVIIADGAGFRGNVRMTGDAPSRPARERASRSTTLTSTAASHRAAAPVRSATRATSGTIQRSSASPPSRGAQRAAAPPPPVDDDEITVVVRHSALRGGPEGKGESGSSKRPPTRKRKTPRARVPARGKRKAVRR